MKSGMAISALAIAGIVCTGAVSGVAAFKPAFAGEIDTKPASIDNYRNLIGSNRLIGATLSNGAGESIGTVDRLLFDRDYRIVALVVEVGGFLGVGAKSVVLPMSRLEATEDGFMLPGANRDQLSEMTPFQTAEPNGASVLSKVEVPLSDSRTRAEVDRTVEEWRLKVDRFTQSAASRTEAGFEKTKAKLDSAWSGVERQWINLKTATKDGWDDAQASFDEAINELERVWQEVAG